MAKRKWDRDLKPATPTVDAARRVLKVRLKAVLDHLPLALCAPNTDAEHVHQLRVAARRSQAALDIFSCCLSGRLYKSAKRELRRIRCAAGAARDWDVFTERLLDPQLVADGLTVPYLELLRGYSLGQRAQAQSHIVALGKNQPRDLKRLRSEILVSVRQPSKKSLRVLRDLAKPMIVRELKLLCEAMLGDFSDSEQLHEIRKLGKRLRYSMEIFVNCFQPAFREKLYPVVAEMQELLGDSNDHFVATVRLRELCEWGRASFQCLWARYESAVESLIQRYEAQLGEKTKAFHAWLENWRRNGGERALSALEMHKSA